MEKRKFNVYDLAKVLERWLNERYGVRMYVYNRKEGGWVLEEEDCGRFFVKVDVARERLRVVYDVEVEDIGEIFEANIRIADFIYDPDLFSVLDITYDARELEREVQEFGVFVIDMFRRELQKQRSRDVRFELYDRKRSGRGIFGRR